MNAVKVRKQCERISKRAAELTDSEIGIRGSDKRFSSKPYMILICECFVSMGEMLKGDFPVDDVDAYIAHLIEGVFVMQNSDPFND